MSPELLRAWERRYGLLEPQRSEGGFRLYSDRDQARVSQMIGLLGSGISAAEAAKIASQAAAPEGLGEEAARESSAPLETSVAALDDALLGFDEGAATSILDGLLASYSTETVLRDAVLPCLRMIGDRWERKEITVAQEHFASNVIRGRLLSIARGWDSGRGPLAILACLPGENHELGLLIFGIVLWRNGWKVTYLGANTPLDSLADAANRLSPEMVVLVGLAEEAWGTWRAEISDLSSSHRVFLAGSGLDLTQTEALGARLMEGDPVTAAIATGRVL